MRQLTAMFLLIAGLALAACGGGDVAAPVITPMSVPTTVPSTAPTAPPEPTAAPVATQPDTLAAAQALAEGRFEYAVALLNKVYGGNRSSDEAAALLAGAYLSWAQATAAQSDGSLEERVWSYSLAYDRYTSGLALLTPDDSAYRAAEQDVNGLGRFIEQFQALNALRAREGSDVAANRAAADGLIAGITALRVDQPELPGIDQLASEALITAAERYEQGVGENQAGIELLRTARGFCEQARELGGTGADECVSSLTTRIAGVQATLDRAASPQRPDPKLVVRRKNQDDQPNCVSIRVLGIQPSGWIFSIDGANVRESFGGADARTCAMQPRQEVTFTLFYPDGRVVPGGGGIRARGGDIFEGNWQQ